MDINFIELQKNLENLQSWLDNIYRDIEKSLIVSENEIETLEYDYETREFIHHKVGSIKHTINRLNNLVNTMIDEIPTFNLLLDSLFITEAWKIKGEGTYTIENVNTSDIDNIKQKYNLDLSKVNMPLKKLVLNKSTSNETIVYFDIDTLPIFNDKAIITKFIYISYFIKKQNNANWEFVIEPLDIFNPKCLFGIKTKESIELLFPAAYYPYGLMINFR